MKMWQFFLLTLAVIFITPLFIMGLINLVAIQWLNTGWNPLDYWQCFVVWFLIYGVLHTQITVKFN